VQPARPRWSVLTTYPHLRLEVHATSPSSPPLPPHHPDGERFQLLCLFPYPRNAQLKRKKHSISIVGRARQRVRSSLLIGSASARHHSAFAKVPALGPRHSRSRLATREELIPRMLLGRFSILRHHFSRWKANSNKITRGIYWYRLIPNDKSLLNNRVVLTGAMGGLLLNLSRESGDGDNIASLYIEMPIMGTMIPETSRNGGGGWNQL